MENISPYEVGTSIKSQTIFLNYCLLPLNDDIDLIILSLD